MTSSSYTLPAATTSQTTTLERIRDEQIGLIEALTPRSMESVPFSVWKGEIPFGEWAEQQPQAAFRRFAINDSFAGGDFPQVLVDVAWEDTSIIVEVAYPDRQGLYGLENMRDMRDIIREDRNQIVDTLGDAGYRNYSEPATVQYIETGEALTLVSETYVFSMEFRVRYYRKVG